MRSHARTRANIVEALRRGIPIRAGIVEVTTIAGTALIITADKTDDGGAIGRVEWDRAGFMRTRTGADYPLGLGERFAAVRDGEGDQVSVGRYPVVDVVQAWEIWSMLGIVAPGIEHQYQETDTGGRVAWMLHPDGSWARATSADGDAPTVHQSGPRRLWDLLDDIRYRWLRDGSLPVYGATITITPEGICHLKRGRWRATISQSETIDESQPSCTPATQRWGASAPTPQ